MKYSSSLYHIFTPTVVLKIHTYIYIYIQLRVTVSDNNEYYQLILSCNLMKSSMAIIYFFVAQIVLKFYTYHGGSTVAVEYESPIFCRS